MAAVLPLLTTHPCIQKRPEPIMVPADLTKDDAAVLLERDEVRRLIDGKPVIKQVFVPGRLLNLVVKG